MLLSLAVAVVGGLASIEAGAFYAQLRLRAWAPPGWVFGPVWTLLYALMAVAAWLVSGTAPSRRRTIALTLYVAQLVPNAGAQGGAGLPAGARQIRNDYGAFAWGGVCPPPGDKPHRYVFTVHALSVPRLDIPDDATAALAGFMVNAHTLAKASFTATYGRP